MKQYQYTTSGTCSRLIDIKLNDDMTVDSISFVGGCHGNLQGIGALVKGLHIDEVISRLDGIRCRDKATSCPDQLACALKQIKQQA